MSSSTSTMTLPDRNCPGKKSRFELSNIMRNLMSLRVTTKGPGPPTLESRGDHDICRRRRGQTRSLQCNSALVLSLSLLKDSTFAIFFAEGERKIGSFTMTASFRFLGFCVKVAGGMNRWMIREELRFRHFQHMSLYRDLFGSLHRSGVSPSPTLCVPSPILVLRPTFPDGRSLHNSAQYDTGFKRSE